MQSAAIPAGVTVTYIHFHIVQQHFWYVRFGGLATSPSMFPENLSKRFITCFTALLSVQPVGNSIEFFFFALFSVCETSFDCFSICCTSCSSNAPSTLRRTPPGPNCCRSRQPERWTKKKHINSMEFLALSCMNIAEGLLLELRKNHIGVR